MRLDDWFLTRAERGNAATDIDRAHRDGTAWTEQNRVEVIVDGGTYFRRLCETLSATRHGDLVQFTDWQGDGDERLDGPGSEVGRVMAGAAERGVAVRGLLWRSHPRQVHFSEQENAVLANTVDAAGGEIILDERVRRGGSHHQKLVVIRRSGEPSEDIAFVGGIDLCHGRHDDQEHAGDPQSVKLDTRYGARPPWHDVQLELRGPAVDDLELTFRERWNDPTPLDHRNPLRLLARRLTHQPRRAEPMPPMPSIEPGSPGAGAHAVQVLRTYPAKRPAFPFAPEGERSIARAYVKAFARARRLIYVEDQYLWSQHAASAVAAALEKNRELHVVAVVPRYPDRDGRATGAAARIGRERAVDTLMRAGGDRVAVFDLENRDGTPIYVHAKVCIIDDVFLVVGSDNLNRRSWTHDSEISCSVIDAALDDRVPRDPGSLGDGARRLARETRLRLWREHLGRAADDDRDLIDTASGFAALAAAANDLDMWHRNGRHGPRPAGHLRRHTPDRVAAWARRPALALYRTVLDPDGRPQSLRDTDTF